jgi:hypothetical protein
MEVPLPFQNQEIFKHGGQVTGNNSPFVLSIIQITTAVPKLLADCVFRAVFSKT